LRRACRQLGFQKPITWTFVPSSADVAGSLGERLVIYHCVDEFSKFTGADESAILQMERGLMEKADMVIVSSSRLYETKSRYNPNTFLVTHGVDVAHFGDACRQTVPAPADCAGLKRPVIGFVGTVADWVDLEVVRHLAASRPEWSFLLVGEVQTDTSALRELSNVHLLGRRTYQSLPAYCGTFDVAILPFVVNELTVAANPLKLREYLAAGLPVVATPLPEVLKLDGLVRMARTPGEFLNQIEALLREGRRGPDPAVSALMERESWDRKVEELSEIIAGLKSGGQRLGRPLPVRQVA
jgi:glycosyltransferase involved in cell wall biosynthesis